MRRAFFILIFLVSQVNGMAFLRITRIKELVSMVHAFKQQGYSRLWWVTDIDGMLVSVNKKFSLVEGEATKDAFKELSATSSHIAGLTKFNSRNALQLAAELRNKGIVFCENAHQEDALILPGSNVDVLSQGIIYAGNPKGSSLVHYLKHIKAETKEIPEIIIFSDDCVDNVHNVLWEMRVCCPQVEVFGVFYEPAQ